MSDDYGQVTELEWVEYELDTIEYDFKIHPAAIKRIRALMVRILEEATKIKNLREKHGLLKEED